MCFASDVVQSCGAEQEAVLEPVPLACVGVRVFGLTRSPFGLIRLVLLGTVTEADTIAVPL